MNLSSGVSLGQLLLAFGVMLVTMGVTWGGLLQRVKTLEKEVDALSGFAERLTRIEEKASYIHTEIGKITGSWLFREPPGYDQLDRPPMPSRPKRGADRG